VGLDLPEASKNVELKPYAIGRVSSDKSVTPARTGQATSSTSLTPQLFYSRRIGLNGSRIIPIDVGGRLTGKVGRYGVGIMNLETRDDVVSKTPRTDFTVVRLKRDILRRSTIGADGMRATNRVGREWWTCRHCGYLQAPSLPMGLTGPGRTPR